MQVTKKSKQQLRLQSLIFTVLFLTVIALLAWFSTQYTASADWTYGNRNSLTEASVKLLRALPEPVQLNVYLPDNENAQTSVEELLKRYQRIKSDFNYRLLNPDLDIELAKAENITQYGQTVVKYNNKKETLNNLDEDSLSNALSRLSRNTDPRVVFLTSHGERNPLENNNTGYSQLANTLTEKGMRVDTINLLSGTLPEDTTALVIASPSHKLLPGEVERIQQYIKSGGNLLWLQDPGDLQGLEALAEQLHITFNPGIIVDADPLLRATLRIEHPAMIAVLEYNFHDITKDIPYNALFLIAGSLQHELPEAEEETWNSTVLFSSRQNTWSETGGLLKETISFEADQGDLLGPLPMALALEHEADTINGKAKQRIVVVADSDFLANSYLGAGANRILGQNIFNWLSQDEQLISIDIKSAPDLQLALDDTEVAIIGIGFLVVLPVGLLVSGFGIWYKRRKRA